MNPVGRITLGGAALGLFVATGWNVGAVRPEVNPVVRPVGLESQDTHAAVSLLGQFRTSLSSWLYLHADLYLHNGVEMRPLSEGEKRAGRKGVGSQAGEDDPLHNDSGIVTVIPSADRDFRGVLGDIERNTSVYRDMANHKHNDPMLALPLFRLMTYLDPQFVPGWTTGASIITRDPSLKAARRGVAFLQEGREQNPQSVEIIGAIGKLYLTRFIQVDEAKHIHRSYALAKPFYEEARQIAWKHREKLSEVEREATLENYRFFSLLLRDIGDRGEMARVVSEGLRVFPDDPILQKFAKSR